MSRTHSSGWMSLGTHNSKSEGQSLREFQPHLQLKCSLGPASSSDLEISSSSQIEMLS